MSKYIFAGGLVAVGFDKTGKYLLTVTHSGRGVFSVGGWERVARDNELAYPENGIAFGIGPIEGETIKVVESYDEPDLNFVSPCGKYSFSYSEGTIAINQVKA